MPILVLPAFWPLFIGWFDPATLLRDWHGWALVGVAVVVFVESGLLFPFLPGDSLLFTAGMLAVSLATPAPWLMLVAALASAAGGLAGYGIGRFLGARLAASDGRLLEQDHLRSAHDFFARHGGVSLVLARFVTLVRTYVPVVAGTVGYPVGRFSAWNAVGAVAWAVLLVGAGALLGHIPVIADHVDLIAVGLVALSLVPLGIGALGRIRAARAAR